MDFVHRYKRRLGTLSSYYDRALLSGSSAEIPATYFLAKPTDFDVMTYRADVCAVPENSRPPSNFRGEVLTVDPEGLSAGYVRIRKSTLKSGSTKGKDGYQKHMERFFYDAINGPAVTQDIGWHALSFDNVYSVQCPYWPIEAQEWRTRHRSHGWPSKDLIDQIVSDGCFLVGKSHPILKDDDGTHWRYSFSKAEMRLISSWTDNQKYVYHVLRLIKSEIVKKNDDKKENRLCTYHFKTQMLWACEENPKEFWEDGNLLTCVGELLTQMMERFKTRNFPNYFLRDCNIIEGNLSEDDLKEIINPLNTGRNLKSDLPPPQVCHECRISISFPVKMALYLHLFVDRFDIKVQGLSPNPGKIQELIDKELDDLMNGIYNMQLAQTLGDSYYVVAEQHFWKGIVRTDPVSSDIGAKRVTLTIQSPSDAFLPAAYQSLANGEFSTLDEERNTWDFSVMINCSKRRCPHAGVSWNLHWNERNGTFSDNWMNPSHLLSVAYLCNIYFITGCYEMCNALALEEQLKTEKSSYADIFPMIFCPELASLFDESIQAVLGLLWLGKHLRGGEGIRFEFCTCPQLFMLYIRIQSSLRLGDLKLVRGAVHSFNVHRIMCRFPFYPHSSHYVLLEMAWRIDVRA